MSFFENTRKPVGLGGKIMVSMMNFGQIGVQSRGLRVVVTGAYVAVAA